MCLPKTHYAKYHKRPQMINITTILVTFAAKEFKEFREILYEMFAHTNWNLSADDSSDFGILKVLLPQNP